MIKQITLLMLIIVFVTISSTVVHELFHQYDFEEIEEICFFGHIESDNFMDSAFGWNRASSYWYPGEKVPTIAGFVSVVILSITLAIIFKEDLRWW